MVMVGVELALVEAWWQLRGMWTHGLAGEGCGGCEEVCIVVVESAFGRHWDFCHRRVQVIDVSSEVQAGRGGRVSKRLCVAVA